MNSKNRFNKGFFFLNQENRIIFKNYCVKKTYKTRKNGIIFKSNCKTA